MFWMRLSRRPDHPSHSFPTSSERERRISRQEESHVIRCHSPRSFPQCLRLGPPSVYRLHFNVAEFSCQLSFPAWMFLRTQRWKNQDLPIFQEGSLLGGRAGWCLGTGRHRAKSVELVTSRPRPPQIPLVN